MAFAAGPEGTIRIPVEATGEEKISDDIFNAFIKGLDAVVKSDAFRKGFDKLIKSVVKSMEAQFEASNKRIEKQLNNLFKNIPKGAASASKSAADSLNHMVPAGVEGAINRLIKQFDRLNAVVSKPPDIALEREIGRLNRALTAATTEGARQQTAAANSALQNQASLTASATKQRIAAWQLMSRQIVLLERGIGKVISATFATAEKVVASFVRGATAAMRGLARAVGTVFTGIGRAATSTFSALGRTIASFARSAGRGFTGMFDGFRNALRRQERDLSSSLGRQSAQIQRFQQQTSRGLAGAITGRGALGIGGGLLAGGGILSFLTSGFERAGAEELLQLTFTTLLQDAGKAEQVLAELSAFARTTSFDFVEVAGSVAQLTAALGDVDQATELTKFLADIVALTGGTTEALGRVRLAITQIASAGKLDASNLRQLTESLPGVPFAQILADRFFGGDVAAFSAARDAGELGGLISAEAFFDAFQDGVLERFPEVEGFAQVAAGTLTGLSANLKENLSIFGAQIIRLFEGPIKAAIGGVNDFLNTLGRFVEGVREVTRPFDLGGGVLGSETTLVPLTGVLDTLRTTIGNVAKALGLLLAIKGVTELFRFLGLAVRFLLRPMGLLVLAFAAIGGISSHVMDAFPGLAANFKVLGDQIRPTLHQIGRLGKALFDLFFGGKNRDGAESFFFKIGRGVRDFVRFIARGLVTIRTFAKLMADLLNAGRGDIAFDVISIRLKNLTEDIAGFLGASLFDTTLAKLQGGNDFLNILETTFLGPVIRFFRGPFSDAIEGLGGLGADIFGIIFGTGDDKQLAGTSKGTSILDRLEETFLAPIVGFFRGPFADAIEFIGGGVADFGGFLGDIFSAIFGEGGGGIGTRIADVLEDTFLGPVVRFFRGPFADGVEAVASFVVDAFRSIVDAFQAIGTLIEPFTDAIGNAVRSLFGGGGADGKGMFPTGEGTGFGSIWAGLTESLGNIGERVSELLDPVITAIGNWFTTNFTAKNFTTYGQKVLAFLNEIGFWIGKVVSSPEFIGALAAVAATLLVLIGATLTGVFEGLLSNAGRWAGLIIDAILAAFGALFNLLPGMNVDFSPLSDALSTALGGVFSGITSNPIFIVALTAFALLRFAPLVLKALGAGLSAIPIVGGTFGKFVTRFGNGLQKELSQPTAVTKFRNVGLAIGGAIMGGLAAFEIGRFAGQSGSTGGVLLGILAGAGTGAAVGAVIGGGVGAGVGAALGATLAGIGAAIGATGAAAEKAKAEIQEYTDALLNIGAGQTALDVGTEVFLQNLSEESEAVNQFFIDTAFNARQFVQGVIDGSGSGEQALADLITTFFETSEAFAGLTADQQNALVGVRNLFDEAAAAGRDLGGADLFRELQAIPGAIDALTAAGIPLEDLLSVFDALEDEGGELGNALKEAGVATQLRDMARAAAEGKGTLEGVDYGSAASKILEIRDAADDSRQAILDLFNVSTYRGSFDAFQDELAQQIPGLVEDFQLAIEGITDPDALAGAQNQFAGNFADFIAGGIQAGIEDESITSGTDLDAILAEITSQIAGLEGEAGTIDSPLEQMLIDALANTDIEAIKTELNRQILLAAAAIQAQTKELSGSLFDADFGTATDSGGSSGFGAKLVGGLGDSITANSSVIRDAVIDVVDTGFSDAASRKQTGQGSASTIGTAMTTQISKAVTSTAPAVAGAVAGAVRLAVIVAALGAGAMFSAGQAIGQGLAAGIASMAQRVGNAARAIALVAIFAARATLQSSSPSVVFQNIGQDIGKGFIQGIKDSEGDMTDAVGTAIQNAIEAGAERAGAAIARAQVGQTIFDNLQPSILPGGTSNLSITQSRADLTTNLSGLLEELRGNVTGAFTNDAAQAFLQSRIDIQGLFLDLREGLAGTREEYREAILAQRTLAKFDADRAKLNVDRASGALGRAEFAEQLAELNKELSSGALTQDSFNKKLAILNKELSAGTLNTERFNEEIKELGTRPEKLTFAQSNLIASGPGSLNLGTIAGQANAGALGSALERIQEFVQTAIEAGTPIDAVIESARGYVGSLRTQAIQAGLSAAAVDSLINSYGVSTAALRTFRDQLLSLNPATAAGAANVATISAALQSIRDYGSELIASGFSTNAVTQQLKQYRDQLIAQATAFGFTRDQISKLITQAGLSDTALANFIKQLQDFDREARNAAATAAAAAKAAADKAAAEAAAGQSPGVGAGAIDRPVIENLNVLLPTGDPEAAALAVFNRLSYGLLVG